MGYTIIIPARIASTRFPEKLMQRINGKTIIEMVWERCNRTKANRIVIATDSETIFTEAKSFGAEVVMTCESHMSGTDRIAEACHKLDLPEDMVVVNVQGDEPLIPVHYIDMVAADLNNDEQAKVGTLASVLVDPEKIQDPSVVKVVIDQNNHALYFSRSIVPFSHKLEEHTYYGHMGLYAYRVSAIKKFIGIEPTPLEKQESLEQLRFLENGFKIRVDVVKDPLPVGVNTQADLREVKQIIGVVDE